jgi:hypothetical protein
VTAVDWLLDSDPSIRWQAMRDLADASKRERTGRWLLETLHPGRMPIETDEGVGRPSRWNTLRALRVLRWYGR